MKIAIVGSGYVGLVSGCCFAEMGVNVVCVDIDTEKIAKLNRGVVPIYEPNLESLLRRNLAAGRLSFTSDLVETLSSVEVVFLSVGTPLSEDGGAELGYILDVASNIGANMTRNLVVVVKSTVPVGTTYKVRDIIQSELDKRRSSLTFEVASNPEFLKEGDAVNDFMKPDRVVVGVESSNAREMMTRLYKPMLLNNFRVIFMDIPSAELTKYAANAMLATRISFMNEIANLCELLGADINMVRKGVGSDSRIGGKYLYAGCGYGGSCFPKDVKALIKSASENGCEMKILRGVEAVNEAQKRVLYQKFSRHYGGDVAGRRAAVWGVAFKPETDDIRESTALVLIESLLQAGCCVTIYDPVAMKECRAKIGDKVRYASDMYDAVVDCDVVFHVTEWKEFRMPSWKRVAQTMRPNPVLIDGRNVFDTKEVTDNGITYYNIGNR